MRRLEVGVVSSARIRLVGLVGLVAVAVLGGMTLAAPAQAAPYTDWNQTYPGFPSDATQGGRVMCESGTDDCLQRTLGEMERRFHRTLAPCNHNAVFGLTYLRVTEDIEDAMSGDYFAGDDRQWMHVLDAMFARTYFLTVDNHYADRDHLVPEAWRVTLAAGDAQAVRGIGNLLLSMNAHLQRDFPFVLYGTGAIRADSGMDRLDGSDRIGAHRAYNDRLRQLYKPMLAELAQRFDPTIDDMDVPGLVADDEAFFQMLVGWRNQAWANARLLDAAHDDAARRLVAAQIETNAAMWAHTIRNATAYGLLERPTQRNGVCAQHGGQDPSYDRGGNDAVARDDAVLGTRSVTVPVTCLPGPGPCRGTVSLPGYGAGQVATAAGTTQQVTLPIGPAQVNALRRAGSVEVTTTSWLRPGSDVVHTSTVAVR